MVFRGLSDEPSIQPERRIIRYRVYIMRPVRSQCAVLLAVASDLCEHAASLLHVEKLVVICCTILF